MFEPDDIRLLVDIGFIALTRGQDGSAAEIFAGVRVLRPEAEAGHIGDALVRLHRGDFSGAIAVLRPLPPTDAVRLFLGMALARAGERDEAVPILSDLASTAATPSIATIASALLDDMQSRTLS